jgi:hypothetical protein
MICGRSIRSIYQILPDSLAVLAVVHAHRDLQKEDISAIP